MIKRTRIRQLDGSVIPGLSNELINFIASFSNSFYQIKEISDNKSFKKKFIVSAIFEYIFFYSPDFFPYFENCIRAIQINTDYFLDLINRQYQEKMQMLDKEFNSEKFQVESDRLVDCICELNYQSEAEFDHKLFKSLTKVLCFTAILIRKDGKIIYKSQLSPINLIVFIQNDKYFILYPMVNFDWSLIINYLPGIIHIKQERAIKLGCFCTVSLSTHIFGLKLWEEWSNLIERCSICKAKNTFIDIQIIKEKRKKFFADKCLYCKGNNKLISFESTDCLLCQDCIYVYSDEIIQNADYILKERFNVKKFLLELKNIIKRIEVNYFKCDNCQVLNIKNDDPEFCCFEFSQNRKICRKCIKKLICQDAYPNEVFIYKNWKELVKNFEDLKVIQSDKEFLTLFCIKCIRELAWKENKIPDHESCIIKYCKKCFMKMQVEICDYCSKPLVNIYYKTPSIYCNRCGALCPKSFVIEGQCYSCSMSGTGIVDESKIRWPAINQDPNLIQRATYNSSEIVNLQTELRIPLNYKVEHMKIELCPEFPDSFEIYAGKNLKFVIDFDDNGSPIAIKATPICKNSNIFHVNFSDEGFLSTNFINQELKGLSIYHILRTLFKIINNPNEGFVENVNAFNYWRERNDHSTYKKMARRFLLTSGLD